MKSTVFSVDNYNLQVLKVNTAVVGSGAAGFNAIDRLYEFGCKDTVLLTEGIQCGTSRNTGSDKQTYYKLTLSAGTDDSVEKMAHTLFDGFCMDGDTALCEAANSVSSFIRLCELGVPFPTNRYGEYVGYKTDHDPCQRGTSVGPLTSKKMTEALESSVRNKGIEIIDNALVVKIITDGKTVKGLLCLNSAAESRDEAYFAVAAKNIIWATGGPAGIYKDSVYPLVHWGMTGTALEAGVLGKNLTEWQFGMASLDPRWNVSGTYMQALPTFVSTDQYGNDPKEFLNDFFSDKNEMLSKIFLKGYQWPFDVRKIDGGSSIIDCLVYEETCMKGRRVFLDYRKNAGNEEIDFSGLSQESYDYLEKAGACFGKPIDRLMQMNAPAVDFYKSRGVDLTQQMLEIAVCAQHNNGGLDIDSWWQTNISGFFACGEAAGTHGVYRPGGSALNSGQVGSLRAAKYISKKCTGDADLSAMKNLIRAALRTELSRFDALISSESNVGSLWKNAQMQMSIAGGPIRDPEIIPDVINAAKNSLENFDNTVKASSVKDLAAAYHFRDALITQITYLGAMLDYSKNGGKSRGSALYKDPEGVCPYEKLPSVFTYIVDDGSKNSIIQLAAYSESGCEYPWRSVRPIPSEDNFFENVWRDYRKNENVE